MALPVRNAANTVNGSARATRGGGHPNTAICPSKGGTQRPCDSAGTVQQGASHPGVLARARKSQVRILSTLTLTTK